MESYEVELITKYGQQSDRLAGAIKPKGRAWEQLEKTKRLESQYAQWITYYSNIQNMNEMLLKNILLQCHAYILMNDML